MKITIEMHDDKYYLISYDLKKFKIYVKVEEIEEDDEMEEKIGNYVKYIATIDDDIHGAVLYCLKHYNRIMNDRIKVLNGRIIDV